MKLELFTNHLILTPLELADVELQVDIWTNPEVVKYIDDVATVAEIEQEMPDFVRRGGNGCIGVWCIKDRKTRAKLGSTYLWPMPTQKDNVDYSLIEMGQMPDADIEVGYFLKPSAWGRGYATEVCKRMLQFSFQQTTLNEVVASVDVNNTASKNVLQKSGFIYRGRTLCWGKESLIYKITRNEWIKVQRST